MIAVLNKLLAFNFFISSSLDFWFKDKDARQRLHQAEIFLSMSDVPLKRLNSIIFKFGRLTDNGTEPLYLEIV